MRKLLAGLLFALCSFTARADTPGGFQTLQSEGPSFQLFTKLFFVSGTTTYQCLAPHIVPSYNLTVSAYSNANPVVLTTTHGYSSAMNPTVIIHGGTGAWTALNNTFIATYIDSTHLSVPVDSTSFGVAPGTLVVASTAPRLTSAVWSVSKFVVDGSGLPVAGLWSYSEYASICANRATLSYQ